MSLTMELAYDLHTEIRPLFQEYTNMLIEKSPDFAEYLQIQNYDRELSDLRHKYDMPEGRIYLARWNGEVAGSIALRRLDRRSSELKRLYVRPQFRGHGIASTLTRRIIDDAREIGYEKIKLDTLPFLRSAISLYERLGFRPIPPYTHSPVREMIFLQLEL